MALGVAGAPNPPFVGFANNTLAAGFSSSASDSSCVTLTNLPVNSANMTITEWIYPTNASAVGTTFWNAGQNAGLSQSYFNNTALGYQNRKLWCLYRLGQFTGENIFTQLFNRITQCQFWCQVTTGPYTGAQYERMADPWECVSSDVNSTGSAYVNELSLSANLQLLELGMDTDVLQDNSH